MPCNPKVGKVLTLASNAQPKAQCALKGEPAVEATAHEVASFKTPRRAQPKAPGAMGGRRSVPRPIQAAMGHAQPVAIGAPGASLPRFALCRIRVP